MSHKKYRAEKDCLNCGTIVEQKFCSACGQENLQIQENFFHMAGHFIADYFHYDSKFFRNLKSLIFKPGFLTKEYLEGKRVRHIHPLRLYFFVTIVMVIVANVYYKKFEKEIKGEHTTISDETGKKHSFKDVKTLEPEDHESLKRFTGAFDNISHNLKYISFFLLPVYAFIFKILYRRKNRFYVNHLVYTLHLQSFTYLLLSLLLLIPLFISAESRDWFSYPLIFVVTVYIVISLRFLYRQSWVKTIIKSIIAMGMMIIVTLLATASFLVVAL